MAAIHTGPSSLSPLERIYAAVSPCVFGTSLAAAYIGGASKDELRARTGRMPPGGRGVVWFHGASAGEMAAATLLVTTLRRHGLCFPVVFTAANRAGVAYISRRNPPDAVAALAPWDVPAWISRAFDVWQPTALLLIETELWPLMVFEAHRRGVPVLSLSARIYPRDVPRYRAIRALIAPTLCRITRILAQNETERDRFIALGAAATRCVAAGNLKHMEEHEGGGDDAGLRDQLGMRAADRVVVFGSVHQGEVPAIFEALDALRGSDARFVIAPRHLSAAHAILKQAEARGLGVRRRSDGRCGDKWRVLVLDTIGELRDFYTIAAVAVIGGGFGKFGGHNPFEALHAGAPVLFGPHFDHFEYEARALTAVTPEAMVSGPQSIAARLEQWLEDESLRRRIVDLQRQTLPDAGAVARRYLEELSPYLAVGHA
jgi:3-deoxy-D-manno-octulosonic-acid transferase